MTPVNATWTSWPRCRAADNGPLRTPKLIEKCSVKPSAEDRELRWNTGYTSVRESRTRPHSESYGRGAEGRLDRDGTPTASRSLDLARSHRVSGSWALTTSGGTCGA